MSMVGADSARRDAAAHIAHKGEHPEQRGGGWREGCGQGQTPRAGRAQAGNANEPKCLRFGFCFCTISFKHDIGIEEETR